jgi:hypothetical protein
MQWTKVWLMLHLYFAFTFVGSLVVAEWVGGIARRTPEWRDRALLFEIVRRSSLWAGLLPLLLLGVLGNVVATGTGLRMATDPWLRTVNGAWLVTVIVLAAVALPNAGRLARLSRAAASGGASEGYDQALRGWRFANLALTLLYVVQLALMVSQARL